MGKWAEPWKGSRSCSSTIAAQSGTERVNPLMYQDLDEEAYANFASKAGADTNPDWFHNLVGHPDVSVEAGTDRVDVRARMAEGSERDRIWKHQKREFPQFAGYEEKTSRRKIPVIVLEPT